MLNKSQIGSVNYKKWTQDTKRSKHNNEKKIQIGDCGTALLRRRPESVVFGSSGRQEAAGIPGIPGRGIFKSGCMQGVVVLIACRNIAKQSQTLENILRDSI